MNYFKCIKDRDEKISGSHSLKFWSMTHFSKLLSRLLENLLWKLENKDVFFFKKSLNSAKKMKYLIPVYKTLFVAKKIQLKIEASQQRTLLWIAEYRCSLPVKPFLEIIKKWFKYKGPKYMWWNDRGHVMHVPMMH